MISNKIIHANGIKGYFCHILRISMLQFISKLPFLDPGFPTGSLEIAPVRSPSVRSPLSVFLENGSKDFSDFNPFFHTKHVIFARFSVKYADVITFFRFFRLFIKFYVILDIHIENYAHCAFCSRNNRGGQICPPPRWGVPGIPPPR